MLFLYNTLELLSVATSNSHFVFCFCNLIIAFLLIGSNSKNCPPNITTDRTPLTNSNGVNVSKEEPIKDQEEEKEQEQEENDGAVAAELEIKGIIADQEEEKLQEEDDDDEFKRRIEQFIDKINKEWKAEKQKTGRRDRVNTCNTTLTNATVI